MEKICLDRACQWQEIGPHFALNIDADFFQINIAMQLATREIESLKAAHGRRCMECRRLLIPTDQDHSFCEDCWALLMYHEFEEHPDGTCAWCGEDRSDVSHRKSSIARNPKDE